LLYVIVVTPTLLQRTKRIPTPEIRTISRISPINRVVGGYNRGIALLFHYRGIGRGWVVSSTSWPHFTPRKDPVPIVQEAGWAAGPVWTGGKSRPHRDSIPDCPARSQQSLCIYYTLKKKRKERTVVAKATEHTWGIVQRFKFAGRLEFTVGQWVI